MEADHRQPPAAAQQPHRLGKGLIELVEEAFGLDPTVPDGPTPIKPTIEGGYLTVTIAKQAGVTYDVQSANEVAPAFFSSATTVILLNDLTTLKVRDNYPISDASSRFMRVQVTGTP